MSVVHADLRATLRNDFEDRVKFDEPMARHTSWHVGGPADLYFEPRDRGDIAEFLAAVPAEVSLHWVGLGSNLLVRDGGIRGAVPVMTATPHCAQHPSVLQTCAELPMTLEPGVARPPSQSMKAFTRSTA